MRACFLTPALLLALALVLACTGATTTTPTPTQPTAVPVPSEATTAVDAALNDAATHLGVSRDQLRVDQVESQEWPDSSLGCPQPGQLYSQIVTPGYLIIITSSDGRQLEYHTDTRSHLTLCHES